MKYNDLWKSWLESKQVPQQYGNPINQYPDNPAYFLKPEDMTSFMNAFSPYDLYNKPDTTPFPMDYSTIAYNHMPSREDNSNKPIASLFYPYMEPNYKYGMRGWDELTSSYGQGFNPQNIPQGVYEHETSHARDYRINPERQYSFPNKGWMTLRGENTSTPIWNREFPAMLAEDRYWDNQKR